MAQQDDSLERVRPSFEEAAAEAAAAGASGELAKECQQEQALGHDQRKHADLMRDSRVAVVCVMS